MKRVYKIAGAILSLAVITLISGCGGGGSSSGYALSAATPAKTEIGVMSLSITDAKPRLPDEPIAVNITVTGIEFNYNGKWTDVNDFEFENDTYEDNNFIRQTFDLLELQNRNSLHLGNIVLPAGKYKEIRFKLDAPEKDAKPKSNPGCNIVFEDAHGRVWSEPLFVPSGGQSGYKGKGEFEITANAQIEIMADFNVEQSIVVAGNSGKYILKPVIRLVVTELSGTINGTVVDIVETFDKNNDDLSVYAYEHDADITIDDEVSGNSEGILFPNAVTSADVNMTDGNFTLSFLGEGKYDLLTVNTDIDGVVSDVDVVEDVEVLIGVETPHVDVNTSDYPTP